MFEVSVDSDGKDKSTYFNEPSFNISVVPHPDLVALFQRNGFTRRGKNTWTLHNTPENRENFKMFFRAYSQKFTPETLHCTESERMVTIMENPYTYDLYTQSTALSSSYFNYNNVRHLALRDPLKSFFNINTVFQLGDTFFSDVVGNDYSQLMRYNRGNAEKNREFMENINPFVLVMSIKNNLLTLRLKMIESAHLFTLKGFTNILSNISRIPYGVTTPYSHMMNIVDFMETIHVLENKFINIFTTESEDIIKEIKNSAENSLFVTSTRGKPNEFLIMNATSERQRVNVHSDKLGTATRAFKPFSTNRIVLKIALSILDKENNVNVYIHPSLVDLQNMIQAQEYKDEARLYGYQRRAVGLHLSTSLGYLNSMDTGIGKSIVQLTAMRERAKNIPNYRGLIVCQSNTAKQWKEYMLDDGWFPEAEVVIVNAMKKTDGLIEVLGKEGPAVVIATFNMVGKIADILKVRQEREEVMNSLSRKDAIRYLQDVNAIDLEKELDVADILVDSHWNDIALDEATSVRNSFGSKQSKALWHIRKNSDIATALTATPFNKKLEDIEMLLTWIRNDKRMFYGNSLSKMYNIEKLTEKDAKNIFNGLYPMVFRFTKEEAAKEEKDKIKIPEEKQPETLLLKPSPSELALSQASEYELKRILNELEAALDNFEAKTDAKKAELAAARESLKEAHGHWMAGTNIARMVTSDPASILESNSIAAQLLIGQGLVHNAMQDVPTKQIELLRHSLPKIQEGNQILVFTDFVAVANNLREAYEKAGIRAGVFGGGNLKKRDENRIAFQRGDLDVLICTKAAERGLTLHRASVVYHYDMSWTLEPLLQKAGRAARVGSENEFVETYILLLQGTIEEKVVEKVFAQGTMSSMVLDKSRGVDIKNTTTGKLMGGLMNTTSNINSRKGALEFGKALLNH